MQLNSSDARDPISEPEENLKAATRLKVECVRLIEPAEKARAKMVDQHIASSANVSDRLMKETSSAARRPRRGSR
jgi:hypothetical protein